MLAPLLLSLSLGVQATGAQTGAPAVDRGPRVIAVPSRPAFVVPPRRGEQPAVPGLRLLPQSLLRTQRPGRMQVQLGDGRSFRLGGDALLRLDRQALTLERGQIIAWIHPGSQGTAPLRIRTRMATASIEGTTVFLEVTDRQVKVFSWEGRVRVITDAGASVVLNGGEELLHQNGRWWPARRLNRQEVGTRLARSLLLNDFPAPIETLPLIRQTLEAAPPAPPAAPAAPPGLPGSEPAPAAPALPR